MTAIQYTRKKGKMFIQRIFSYFTILFGFFTVFFITIPKILTSENLNHSSAINNFFIQEVYADTPTTGDAAGCAGDSACGVGSAGACADGSAGSCSCGDGVGCVGDATA